MINLLGWGLEDYTTFGDTEIKLSSEHGLYIISGDNRDSTIKDNTNAVGKSRLTSCIPTTIFENDPMSLTKKNRKDILRAKSSSTYIDVKPHAGQVHRIVQTASKIFIMKQGKDGKFDDQKAIKLEVARSKIAQLFPLSETMFYATCYIQAMRPCDFQRAKPNERLAFITDLFDLHVYDELRKWFGKKLSELAKVGIEHKTLAQELQESLVKLKSIDWSKEQSAELKKFQAKLDKISERLKVLYEEAGQLKQSASQVEKVKQLQSELADLKDEIGVLEPTKKTLRELKELYAAATECASYKTLKEEYDSQVGRLQEKLDDLPNVKGNLKSITAKFDKLSDVVSDLESELKAAQREHRQYVELKSEAKAARKALDKGRALALKTKLAKTAGLSDKKEKAWQKAIAPIVELAKLSIQLTSKLDSHDHLEKCPVCHSKDFDAATMRKSAKAAAVVMYDYETIQDYLHQYQDVPEVPAKPTSDVDALIRNLSDAKIQLGKLRKQGSALTKREAYEEQMESLRKPKKPKVVTEQSPKVYHRQIAAVEKYINIESRIGDMDISNAKQTAKRLKTVNAEIADLQSKSDTLEKKCRVMHVSKIEFKECRERVTRLKEKLAKIEPELQKHRLYKTSHEAYAPNNLKLQAAEQILGYLEDSLNRYSHLVFLEPMRFEIRTQKTGISAQVYRNNSEPSDISQLSGAETNSFRLLFALSLLPLLPENKRTNFLILDEPDANCSPAVRSHLIREFLPKLRSVVPHVFWITPDLVDDFDDYTLLKVIKEGGSSHVDIVSNED